MTVPQSLGARLTGRLWPRLPGGPDGTRGTDRTNREGVALIAGAIAMAALGTFLATRFNLIGPAIAVVVAPAALLLCLRWPLLPLYAFAALIPLEDRVRIGDLATGTKIAGGLFALMYAISRLRQVTLSSMPLWGWLFAGWAVLSVAWSLSPDIALGEIPTLAQLFAISVLIADAVAHDPRIVRRLLWVYSAACGVTALIAIGSYLTGAVAIGSRVSAAESQDVAQFAVLLLPALVFSLYELLQGRFIALSAAVAGATAVAILLSGTRGAWLSAIVVIGLFVLPRLSMRQRVMAIPVVAGLAAVALQLPGVADLVIRRAQIALETGGAGRTDIWSVATTIFGSSPITGVGFANFPVAFDPHLIQATDVAGAVHAGSGSHSIVFGTLAELGIVGFALLTLFLVPLILRRGWGPDGSVVQAALTSLLVAGLFLDIIANRKQVWLVIGIAAGLAWLRDHRVEEAHLPGARQMLARRRNRLRGASGLSAPSP